MSQNLSSAAVVIGALRVNLDIGSVTMSSIIHHQQFALNDNSYKQSIIYFRNFFFVRKTPSFTEWQTNEPLVNITYSWHTFCWQNIFLAYVLFIFTKLGTSYGSTYPIPGIHFFNKTYFWHVFCSQWPCWPLHNVQNNLFLAKLCFVNQ